MKATIAILCMAAVALVCTAGKWARVQDNTVQEVWPYRPNFHPDVMRQIEEAPDTVGPKWRKRGDEWLPPKTSEDFARDRFDKLRARLLQMSGTKARRIMSDQFVYRLTGPLDSGYPDPTQSMTTNGVGTALSLDDFMDYLQERQDGDATPEELQALRQQAKQARMYLKSLKGD